MTLRLRACIAGAALLTVVAVAGAVPAIGSGAGLFVLTSLATGLMFGLTGALLTGLRPANPLGPLLVTAGGALTLEFALRVYAAREHSAVAAIGLALDPLFFPVPIALLVLLFPDGRLPSRRWRPVLAAGLLLTVVAVILNLIRPGPIPDETFHYDIPWTGALPAASADRVAGLSQIVTSLGLLLLVVAAGNLVVRLARTTGEDRRRLIPLALAGGLAAGFLLLQPVPGLHDVAVAGFVAAVAVGLPAALIVGALRYRVWDLDQVLVTTIVYGALTIGITAVYVGVVVTFGRVAGTTGSTPALLPSVVATALVAILFAPVKERISRTARRMVLGVRATPYEALAALPRQLAQTPAPGDVLPGTARALALGLGVPAARVRAYTGAQAGEAWFPATPAPEATPDLIEVPVWHLGEVVGDVAVRSSVDRPLTPADRRLLADLAAQAGPALRGVILAGRLEHRLADLAASRRRIVTAEARGRRRLERDIHDGVQQHMVALAVSLGAAETDPSALARARADLDRCLQDLRDLARGIYPPVLATRGLVAAVKARARAAPATVEVTAGPGLDGLRPGEDVELAAYFAVLEALQNAVKHAPGTAVTVRFDADDGWLRFTVADDGPGFDPAQPGDGTGLTGIADRVGAVGGTVEITAAPGAGVRVEGRLPLTTAAATLQTP
ncbi:sensor histidine kinase [Paractinoplanes maris]|uniref:sensor histidine kinase n=1 Tax=Paractinoplanes maris TaxID=1734446 RepID=UPI0020200372|nr:sensor histidine kinase [Actinoplanes maris]